MRPECRCGIIEKKEEDGQEELMNRTGHRTCQVAQCRVALATKPDTLRLTSRCL